MTSMTLQQFYEKAKETNQIFSVEFIKRGDGSTREMVCRTGVTKGTSGGSIGYNPDDHGLLPVYDMHSKGYRSIPIGSINRVTIGGVKYLRDGYNLIPIKEAT